MDIISEKDINGWWNKLNEIRTRLGQSTIPYTERNVGEIIKSSDIQPLKDEFTSMQTDTYYKFATYVDVGDVSIGAVCKLPTKTAVNETLDSIDNTIKCRNTSICSDGYESYGTNRNGTATNGSESNGDRSNGQKSNGSESNGTCLNGENVNGNYTNGGYSYDSQHNGSCFKGTDSRGGFLNGFEDNGTRSNGDESNGFNNNGLCNNVSKENGTCIDVENINK